MKSIKLPILMLLTVFMLSCGTNNVQTEKMNGKDLTSYKTFAYLPNASAEIPGTNYNDEEVNVRIIETINRNMQEAGYVLDRENPDLLVLISTRSNASADANPHYASYPYANSVSSVQPFYNPYYYSGYNTFSSIVGYNGNPERYIDGAVIIYLVDRKDQEAVWRGIASDNIYDEDATERIQGLVDAVFKEYPIKN